MKADRELLEMALLGYGLRLAQIEEHIKGVKMRLAYGESTGMPAKRREISPAGRERIAAATRKRWAAYRRAKKAGQHAGR